MRTTNAADGAGNSSRFSVWSDSADTDDRIHRLLGVSGRVGSLSDYRDVLVNALVACCGAAATNVVNR